MAISDLTSKTICFYDDWIQDADPRVEEFFLMSLPLPQPIIIGLYVYFVTSQGPKLMEVRKSFELRRAMITYNF
ncbi:elongation of very long chain fatty acids protein 7 [Sigmodon hispidus]